MLGKLIKHEFRATARIMLPLFVIVLAMSGLAHFAMRGLDSELPQAIRVLLGIVMVLFVIGLIAVSLMSFIIMVRRFRTNILGDEGYLTMTLPAGVHSIIWSKIIVSVVWFVATVAVVALSMIVLFFRVEFVSEAFRALSGILKEVKGIDIANYSLMLLELLLNALIAGITTCLSIYSALSIGYGCARHKMLFSVIAFFVLGSILSYGFSFILIPFFPMLEDAVFDGADMIRGWHTAMGLTAVIALLQGAIHYVITVWNLRHRLNLE